MDEDNLKDRVEYDLRQYVELRIDSAKLAAVEGLSAVAGSAIGLVICLFLVNLALTIFTGVLVYLLDMLLHSWVWAAVCLGMIYLLVGVWVLRRPGMFRNMMVRVFAPMFFCHKKFEEDDDDECDR